MKRAMDSKAGRNPDDLWSEIIGNQGQHRNQQLEVVYRRRRPQNTLKDVDLNRPDSTRQYGNTESFAAAGKRVSWNRSLSTRGRTSIAVGSCVVQQPQVKKDKRKGKPALPKGKFVPPPNLEKERAYFQEVDAFELMEESPSPKKFGTWVTGSTTETVTVPPLCPRLHRYLNAKRFNLSCGPSSTLSKILNTPSMALDPICDVDLSSSSFKTQEKSSLRNNSQIKYVPSGISANISDKSFIGRDMNSQKHNTVLLGKSDEGCEAIEAAVKKLSLASLDSADGDHVSPFIALLALCGQFAPLKLHDVLSKYCVLGTISKIGEGTYGEAFRIGNNVCKIVPIDGDLRVNGEVQKRSEELLEEAILSRTLNQLRGHDADAYNSCRTFVETIDLRVCQGSYDASLIRAWDDWDEMHGSENDHPKEFSEKQCYVVFVLEHGGKDLENFVLLNYDEARSLLVQVTAALAVAESAYEFEHRDLHWGNVLLSRNDSGSLQYILEGKHICIKTYGLSVCIIDFTLSRINTGDDILFLDLSLDPDLFKGPKGEKQSETYRKMKEVTDDCWEGSYPKTNVLWLVYLIDILLLKKSFERTSKDERDLRSLKKRLDKYNSAREAIFDPFYSDLFVEQ